MGDGIEYRQRINIALELQWMPKRFVITEKEVRLVVHAGWLLHLIIMNVGLKMRVRVQNGLIV